MLWYCDLIFHIILFNNSIFWVECSRPLNNYVWHTFLWLLLQFWRNYIHIYLYIYTYFLKYISIFWDLTYIYIHNCYRFVKYNVYMYIVILELVEYVLTLSNLGKNGCRRIPNILKWIILLYMHIYMWYNIIYVCVYDMKCINLYIHIFQTLAYLTLF